MGRVSTCQKNCNTIDLRRAQVNHTGNYRKPQMEEAPNLSNIDPTNPIEISIQHEFLTISYVSFKWYF